MAPTALVVLTTLANDADARALVTALVAARLVACGTLLPGARGSRADRGSGIAHRDQHHRIAGGCSPRWAASPGHRAAAVASTTRGAGRRAGTRRTKA